MKKYIKSNKTFDVDCDITLDGIVKKIKINGPAYRGARQPEFDPYSINESKFPDNARFKYIEKYEVDEKDIYVNIVTQEPFDDSDANAVVREVGRAIVFNTERCGYGPDDNIQIHIEIECRDGAEYGSFYWEGSIYEASELK